MLQHPHAGHDCVNGICVNGIAITYADHFAASAPAYQHRIGDQAAPHTGTTVGVLVSTAPGARITVVAHFEAGDRKKTARADSTGSHKFWFSLGSAPPGVRVTVIVRVAAHGQKRSTRVWFTRASLPLHLLLPLRRLRLPRNLAAATPPSRGNCYEPGEFCPQTDPGMTGVAGDGETIICEDNNGLRWEPA